jgi:hypothetical protein
VVTGDWRSLTLEGTSGQITVKAPYNEESGGWQPVRRIELTAGGRTFWLAVDDLDPYRACFHAKPMERLSIAEFDRWRAVVRRAWDLLASEQPEHCVGMARALGTVVPTFNPESGANLSATARGAFGVVALSSPTDPEGLAESLVHEFQHTKLGALQDLVDLVVSGSPGRFHAPWRADPRPAEPLLDGVYAHVGVTGFWRERWRRSDAGLAAAARFRYWTLQTSYALRQLLDTDELTAHGRVFAGVLAETLRAWLLETVPAQAETSARREVLVNRLGWRLRHQVAESYEIEAVVGAWRKAARPPPVTRTPRLASHQIVGQPVVGDDEAYWIGLIATVTAEWPSSGPASLRPELLRATARRLRAQGESPDTTALAVWLDGAPPA